MRRKRLLYNTIAAFANQIIMLICNFILPRQILLFYGSEANGLVTSITQFLGFIALTEMGVTAVVQSALYKPIANDDYDEISRIIKSSRNFFNKIGLLLIAYVAVLCFIYPMITESEFDVAYTAPLIVAISISSIAQYYFGMTYLLFLNADQRAYIHLILNGASIIINTVISVLLMHYGASLQVVKLAASVALLIKPIGIYIFVNHHYTINKKITLNGEPIKQKWNGMAQHAASFILSHTDVIVLTFFSTLTNVSIYNVYYLVVAGLRQLITVALTGVEALFGNLYATNDQKLNRRFGTYEWIMHTAVTLIFTVAALLICPFISVYTLGVNDAEYIHPLFGGLLVASYGFYCIRLPYNTMVLAAGHYKQTQASAIIEASINVVLSVVAVKQFGLCGVAVGTMIAMIYRTCYLAHYLSKAILHRPIKHFIKHVAVDFATAAIVYFSAKWLICDVSGYLSWMVLGLKVFTVGMLEVCLVNCLIYKDEVKEIGAFLNGKIRKK